jgi:hypothetical protein
VVSKPEHRRWRPKLPEGEVVPLFAGAWLRRTGEYDASHAGRTAKGYAYLGEGRAVGMLVLATIDNTHHGRLLHCSLSYDHRDPTWEEIKAVRAAFLPAGVDAGMLLPREADYVDVHPFCYHVWQLPVEWGLR